MGELAKQAAEAASWEDMCRAMGSRPTKKLRGVKSLGKGKYAAEIWVKELERTVWLGTFPSLKLAACAYELAARGILSQGRKASPNFEVLPSPALRLEFEDELDKQELHHRKGYGPRPACLVRFRPEPAESFDPASLYIAPVQAPAESCVSTTLKTGPGASTSSSSGEGQSASGGPFKAPMFNPNVTFLAESVTGDNFTADALSRGGL
ncbi:ethylene-responsive transcription factor CRF6 [Brachypodium distachyon]|nr:ethylene-responsive transcription factor CRF6 [Brachypodium distachyon]|eukprot:XP_010229789.1 ethylene-responsive transcription factor CRF6 [Brachypodium distachyon]